MVEDAGVVQLLLVLAGSGGLIGAVVALLKLKPDANSQAVVQAQGAAAEWERLYRGMVRERDYWRERAIAGETLVVQLRDQMQALRDRGVI